MRFKKFLPYTRRQTSIIDEAIGKGETKEERRDGYAKLRIAGEQRANEDDLWHRSWRWHEVIRAGSFPG